MTRGAVDRDSSIAMAAHTKSHFQRRNFLYDFHLLNLAVTALATDASFYVALVIEVSVFRQIIYGLPLNRLILVVVFLKFFNFRALGLH